VNPIVNFAIIVLWPVLNILLVIYYAKTSAKKK
jgi:hypothetical protein